MVSFLAEKYMVTDVIVIGYRNPLIGNEWAISFHLRTTKPKNPPLTHVLGIVGSVQSKMGICPSLLIGGCG